MGAEGRLKELGLVLPPLRKPVANYLPYCLAGNLLFLAGQRPATKKGQISPASSALISASRKATGAPGWSD
jgi:hypothetical protein